MPNDTELLRSYAENGSEPAFAELVRRQVNLVYSAALRETHGDTGLAEDVTQAVFHELARKASSLIRHPALSGWLYTSVRLFAANVRRSEQRRQRREQEASAMSELTENESPESVWQQVRPALDEAMHELSETDRATVVLRFFEGRNLSEIGQTLGLRENAARMRVDRALEKLRGLLAKRGITSTASGLAAALAAGAVMPAPSALAAAVTASAVASVATTSALTATIQIIAMNKTTVGVISVLLAASAGIPLWQQSRLKRLQSQNEALQAQVQKISSLQKEIEQLQQKQAALSPPAPMGDKNQAELLRLRGQVGVLRRQAAEGQSAQNILNDIKRNNAPKSEPAGGSPIKSLLSKSPEIPMLPASSWTNLGFATPVSTIQTLNWALQNQDTNAFASAMMWDAQVMTRAGALFAALPQSVQEQYGSLDGLLLDWTLAHSPPTDSYRVLSQTEQGPNDMTLVEQRQYADGQVRENSVHYHRDESGNWRQVIPTEQMPKLEAMINDLSGAPPAGAPPAGGAK